MSGVMTTETDTADLSWAMLAVAREIDTAEEWQAALADADIESEIRFEDAVVTGRSTATNYANGPGVDQLFAYALWVPATAKEEAAATLIEAGWDGKHGQPVTPSMSPSYVVRGTLIAIAVGALLFMFLARGGA
jgi:hypothetical protein